jgi:hypothetical protein
MKGLDLLEKYPLAANVIKEWFLKSMVESFKDESVPEEFKQFMIEQGIEDDKVGTLIDINPRMLLDVFDENEVFIFIHYMDVKDNVEFFYSFRNIDNDSVKLFKTRKEAELFAIEAAFEILETKLTPPPPPVEEIPVVDEEIAGEEIVEEN